MPDVNSERYAAYLKLLGATDVKEVSALAQEYYHRLSLCMTASSTAGALTFSKPVTISDSLVQSGAVNQTGTIAGTHTVSGAVTYSGVSTFSDSVAITGVLNPTGKVTHRAPVALIASDTILATQSGATFIVKSDTTGVTATLPAVAQGVWYTFFLATQGNTAADFGIKPVATEAYQDQGLNTGATVKDGLLSDANDTGAGAGGEYVTLVGSTLPATADHRWVVTGRVGTWKNNTNP